MTRLETALLSLIKMIDDGWEFPDAVSKVSNNTNIDVKVLTELYDEFCIN